MLRKSKKLYKRNNQKICIAGASRKAGVTHVCLCLANFVHAALGQKVIYVELADESQLLEMVGRDMVRLEEDIIGFKYKGIIYVLTNDVNEVKKLITSQKVWCIVDIQRLDKDTFTIYDMCDKRVLLGSLQPWCVRDYHRLVNKIKENSDVNQQLFFGINIEKKEKKTFEKNYDCEIKALPRMEDPFMLKEEYFDTLLEMIM